MATHQDFGQRFVRLGLAIDEHQPGYVDAFFGLEEWRVQAKQRGKGSLSDLKQQVDELAAELSAANAMNPQRNRLRPVQ